MIIALFALSAAMVIGGVVAVIQGFPFVRLESGLSMVIAGATVASAGAVLSGLAVVAMGLRRVAHAFDARRIVDAVGTIQDGVRLPPAAPAPLVDPFPAAPATADPAPGRPTLPSVVDPAVGAGLLGGQTRADPAFAEAYAEPAIPEPVPAAAHETHEQETLEHEVVEHGPIAHPPADAQAEPELPLPGLTPPEPEAAPPAPPPPPASPPEPEDDLFAPAEPALRPSLDAEPAKAAPEPAAREVVGRYASGGNTYVMYADGAIEADTPQGRFTFASLDELKAFVEAGGEGGNRGAA
ncbi:hypothetical protein AFCDBAGC_2846 [Methylobacterium cerastii]|uniref:DUF308 domain-containing protein n=1 Tax=Methylobacterium cerastii TaxID=932741 RepID=A0ABQ4QJG1_9HYPH|nr:hypothetical protein [Methylobacterium cerastii]GJD44977.1 hypothetical protein AFCDBAGC_2846 [Methylobacterium cerastii]